MSYLKIAVLTISVAMFAIIAVPEHVYAEESDSFQSGNQSFSVGKYLKTGEQGQKYLADSDKSPVAAFIVAVIDFLSKVVGVIALLVFILGALLTITSEGRDDQLQKGKQAMLYAVIGLALAFTSYIIATFVQSIFYG